MGVSPIWKEPLLPEGKKEKQKERKENLFELDE